MSNNGNRRKTVPCQCNQIEPEPCEIHDPMNVNELRFRRSMAVAAIQAVQDAGDPYGIIDVYKLQVQNIEAAIKVKNKRDKPPPTRVGLKTGSLSGKAQKGGVMQ